MKRLLVCYNPRASHHEAVTAEVLSAVRKLPGWMVGRYEIKATSFADNARKISQLATDGDLVIVAGGDGSATMVVNGIMASGKDATLGVLGYGNFNDIAGMLGVERSEVSGSVKVLDERKGVAEVSDARQAVNGNLEARREGDAELKGGVAEIIARFEAGEIGRIYPLDITVNGEHWRYAPSYMTMGMFARSTEIFEMEKVRKRLQTGKKGRTFSIWQLMKWYFGHRKESYLPEGAINGKKIAPKTTDYIVLNGATMAGMMRGGDWYQQPKGFISATGRLGSLARLLRFMWVSMRRGVPGEVHERDVIEFAQPSEVELHTEGEYEKLVDVSRVEVQKTGVSIKVIMGK